MKSLRRLLVLAAMALLAGCSAEAEYVSSQAAASYEENGSIETDTAGGEATNADGPNANATGVQAAAIERKLIYQANIDLVVNNFDGVDEKIRALVDSQGGYLAESNIDSRVGDRRYGTWVVRAPTGRYDAFTTAVIGIGALEERSQTVKDVTEEFVDLTERIKNAERLEERIVALLADKSGKIKDVIEVERELARVRGEIEVMQGRLRYLTNRTDFSTVTIRVREQRDYMPAEAPTFGQQIASTWNSSLETLAQAGRGLVLVVVGAAPWLAAFFVLVIVPFILFIRFLIFLGRRKGR